MGGVVYFIVPPDTFRCKTVSLSATVALALASARDTNRRTVATARSVTGVGDLVVVRSGKNQGRAVPDQGQGVTPGAQSADITALAYRRRHLPRPSLANDASLRNDSHRQAGHHPVDVSEYIHPRKIVAAWPLRPRWIGILS